MYAATVILFAAMAYAVARYGELPEFLRLGSLGAMPLIKRYALTIFLWPFQALPLFADRRKKKESYAIGALYQVVCLTAADALLRHGAVSISWAGSQYFAALAYATAVAATLLFIVGMGLACTAAAVLELYRFAREVMHAF
jgi:hypothetical protein